MAQDARCRLYLVLPAAEQVERLDQALDAADVACVLLRLPEARAQARRRVLECRPVVQSRGAALLLTGDAALAAETGADGVHLDDARAYREARRVLGEDAIVGAGCGRSRHAAMEAGEAGADYVAFAGDAEIIEDWAAMTVVPCVVMGGVSLDNAAVLAAAGADFLAVEDAWSHPGGPMAALRAYGDVLATGTRSRPGR